MGFRKGLSASRAVVLLAGLPVCGSLPAAVQSSQPAARYREPAAVCEITDPRLNEASGLAASRRNPGYYYTHNDSGGQPHVYVLDRRGRIYTTIRLLGVANVDWEDIALAPGKKPTTYDVCVADIGDNNAARAEIVIYRFREPDLKLAIGRRFEVEPQAIRCKYEDGARDAEGFAVHPPTGDGYVFTKQFDGACQVYRLPAPWTTVGFTTLRRAGALKLPREAPPLVRMVTAADISPDGKRLVTRSYLGGWEWRLPESGDASGFARIFRREPVALKLAIEPQGEALCFSADGNALLTISEKSPTMLYEVRATEGGRSEQP
ncbi:MAG: hypothetical protein ACE5I3_12195 [Phycisphaerae bacterium]